MTASHRTVTGMLLIALATVALGCTATVQALRPKLGISNGTTLTVRLTVNGQKVAESVPGAPQPVIDTASLPPLPWEVEARSVSGRLLTSMHVDPGQVDVTTDAGSLKAASGVFGRVDLSCGRLTIWAGAVEPSGPAPVGSQGTAGDCAP